MANPTTVNQAATISNEILKAEIQVGSAAIEAALIADQPWLGLPFVKQIFEFVLSKVSNKIYEQAAMAATKLIIDYQVNREKSQVISAFDTLQMAVASGDKNAIQKASSDLSDTYGSLIHSDGSASP